MPKNRHPVIKDPALEDPRATDIIIPVIGETGAGKSSFINFLLKQIGDQREVCVTDQLASCTTSIQSIVIEDQIQNLGVPFKKLTEDNRIVVVDTPGFDNGNVKDEDIVGRICKWIQAALKKKVLLGGVIYLHDISRPGRAPAMAAWPRLHAIRERCVEVTFDKVILVTTKWGRQADGDFERREEELYGECWNHILLPVSNAGASAMRLDDNGVDGGVSSWQVVSRILTRLDARLADVGVPAPAPSQSRIRDTGKRRARVGKLLAAKQHPALSDSRSTDIVIPVIGATGAGKSFLINCLLEHIGDRRRVEVGDQLAACTYDLESIIIDGQIQRLGVPFTNLNSKGRIVLIDTPGFEECMSTDFPIVKRIAEWLRSEFKHNSNMMLGGVIYLYDISRDRYCYAVERNVSILGKLCDEATLDRVVLVTSKWSPHIAKGRDFGRREGELRDEHWRDMLHDGATVMRLDDSRGQGDGASAWAVITRMLRQLDTRLGKDAVEQLSLIQRELVSSRETNLLEAAREMRDGLESALRIQEEIRSLEALAVEGDAEAEEKLRGKEEQLRAMQLQEAIQQDRTSRLIRLTSGFRRFRRSSVMSFLVQTQS